MRKLTVNWQEIQEARETQGLTFEQLGEKFGVKPDTIAMRASRYNWSTPAKRLSKKVVQELVIPNNKALAKARQRIVERAADEVAAAVGEFVRNSVDEARRLMTVSQSMITDGIESGNLTPRALRDLAGSWETGHRSARLALGLDSPLAQSDQSWGGRRGVNLTIDLSQDDVIVSNPEQSTVREHDLESGSAPTNDPAPPPA